MGWGHNGHLKTNGVHNAGWKYSCLWRSMNISGLWNNLTIYYTWIKPKKSQEARSRLQGKMTMSFSFKYSHKTTALWAGALKCGRRMFSESTLWPSASMWTNTLLLFLSSAQKKGQPSFLTGNIFFKTLRIVIYQFWRFVTYSCLDLESEGGVSNRSS